MTFFVQTLVEKKQKWEKGGFRVLERLGGGRKLVVPYISIFG